MSSYNAPIRDMQFVMRELADLEAVAALPGCEDAAPDVVDAILEEAGKFAGGVLAPLNWEGDKNPSSWKGGEVTATPGFKEAFKQFTEGGWQGLQHPVDFGGQGLPLAVHSAVNEIWSASNLAFGLCPLLTLSAIDALDAHGSKELKDIYLEKLISGEWTGTMCLTEPHCGTDLGLMRTKAEPQADGTYKLTGNKIFISAGEHDMADNIIHLVLARLPDAPPGIKGVSLFIVPIAVVGLERMPTGANPDMFVLTLPLAEGKGALVADPALASLAERVEKANGELKAATMWFMANGMTNPNNVGAGAHHYMHLMGIVALGLMWLKMGTAASAALAAGSEDKAFHETKLTTARYYGERFTPDAGALRRKIEADPSRPQLIVTERGAGYCFNVPVESLY